VTALVDADTEEVVASYQYTPYGQMLHAEGDPTALSNNPFGFSTKYHDAELPGAGDDLVYYGYRFYHPALQVWLNRDPIAEDGGLNLYAFVANQPNTLIDPYGLTPEEDAALAEASLLNAIDKLDEADSGFPSGVGMFKLGFTEEEKATRIKIYSAAVAHWQGKLAEAHYEMMLDEERELQRRMAREGIAANLGRNAAKMIQLHLDLGNVESAKQVQQRFMDAGGDVATLAGAGAAGEVVLEETGTEIAMSPITAVGGALAGKLLKRAGGWALKKTVRIGKKTVDVAIDRSRITSRRLRDRIDAVVRNEAAESAAPNKTMWSSWANYPKVTSSGREYAQVGDRLYTRHAVDRMQPSGLGAPAGASSAGRSIAPTFVEEVIQNGSTTTRMVDGVQRTIHTSGSVQVVTEQGGKIVVTINPFSGGM